VGLQLDQAANVRVFVRDVEDGARGCYTSHLAVYREAVSRDLPWALIFEDNLALLDPSSACQAGDLLCRVAAWASQKEHRWDVLHLSLVHSAASLRLLPVDAGSDSGSPVVQVQRTAPDWYGPVPIERAPGLGTTAYLVSRGAMEAMVAADSRIGYSGIPIDDLLARLYPGSTYGAFPAPLHRGNAPSLINPDQQLFRAVMYDPRVVQNVEQALVATGLSSSQLVWAFLATMAAWTVGVTLPVVNALLR
ncbi:unnamed protein product, partial [Polarella glacialis]